MRSNNRFGGERLIDSLKGELRSCRRKETRTSLSSQPGREVSGCLSACYPVARNIHRLLLIKKINTKNICVMNIPCVYACQLPTVMWYMNNLITIITFPFVIPILIDE